MSVFRISIVIPTFNSSRFIEAALVSVFNQTLPAYEVIVVNDGSPDSEELEAVLEPYRSRIVYLKQSNGGPSKARNTGIRCAQGEYVAFLDSDDRFLPHCLETQVNFLRSDISLDMVYADLLLEGDTSLAGKTFMQFSPSVGEVTFDSILIGKCQIPTSAVVAKKQALLDAGMFDEKFSRSEDYDLWLRLAHLGKRSVISAPSLEWKRTFDLSYQRFAQNETWLDCSARER